MNSGVYKITNIVNNKCYIGSSHNLKRRLYVHNASLKGNYHHSNHLQSSYNKHGQEAFTYTIVCYCPKEDLIRIEQYLIDYYQPEYNVRKIADSNLGLKRTEEQRKNISNSLKGRKLSEEHKKNTKLGRLNSNYVVSDETRRRLHLANIGKVLSPDHKEKLRISHLGYKVKQETKEKLREIFKERPNTWQSREIIQFDFNTKIIINTFISVAEAVKQTGVHYSSICKCARGEQKQAGGFLWKYVETLASNIDSNLEG